jgi:hypothetical protein
MTTHCGPAINGERPQTMSAAPWMRAQACWIVVEGSGLRIEGRTFTSSALWTSTIFRLRCERRPRTQAAIGLADQSGPTVRGGIVILAYSAERDVRETDEDCRRGRRGGLLSSRSKRRQDALAGAIEGWRG